MERKRLIDQDDGPYEVGYGKPPKETQFKKGESGNPAGRPRGGRRANQDLASLLLQAVTTKVVVNEGGKRRTMTKLDVSLQQLVNKAAGGDLRALEKLIQHLQRIELTSPSGPTVDEATDMAHIEAIRQRLAARAKSVVKEGSDEAE